MKVYQSVLNLASRAFEPIIYRVESLDLADFYFNNCRELMLRHDSRIDLNTKKIPSANFFALTVKNHLNLKIYDF